MTSTYKNPFWDSWKLVNWEKSKNILSLLLIALLVLVTANLLVIN